MALLCSQSRAQARPCEYTHLTLVAGCGCSNKAQGLADSRSRRLCRCNQRTQRLASLRLNNCASPPCELSHITPRFHHGRLLCQARFTDPATTCFQLPYAGISSMLLVPECRQMCASKDAPLIQVHLDHAVWCAMSSHHSDSDQENCTLLLPLLDSLSVRCTYLVLC